MEVEGLKPGREPLDPQPPVDNSSPSMNDRMFRVRIEHLRLPPAVAAGMNPLVLMSLAYRLRSTTGDPEPVKVTPEPDGSWRIHDGRHRAIAALIAGRPDVLAVQTATEAPKARTVDLSTVHAYIRDDPRSGERQWIDPAEVTLVIRPGLDQ